MEFIDGIELKDKIKSGPISTEETINIAIQIAKGLEAAHKKGIIHRDIKSQNVMIAEEDKVKIMDFGLAKIQGETGITKNDSTPGTVSYMSPEQARGEAVDSRSDVFSFGILLYKMFAGVSPFEGGDRVSTIAKILEAKQEPIRQKNATLPAELERIIDKCLQKDPNDRYQNTRDLAIDLRSL